MARPKNPPAPAAGAPEAPVVSGGIKYLNELQKKAFERAEKKKADQEARKVAVMKQAQVISAEFAKTDGLIWLPYKAKDGKTFPCLVLYGADEAKKDVDGGIYLTPDTREEVYEYQLHVIVFGASQTPMNVIYNFDKKGE